MVLIEKSNKRKKSHSVKKSEIFCCVLKFKIHFLKRKSLRKRRVYAGFGADSRTRTDDLRITNALLYQLSHTSTYASCDESLPRSQCFQYIMLLKVRQYFFEIFLDILRVSVIMV